MAPKIWVWWGTWTKQFFLGWLLTELCDGKSCSFLVYGHILISYINFKFTFIAPVIQEEPAQEMDNNNTQLYDQIKHCRPTTQLLSWFYSTQATCTCVLQHFQKCEERLFGWQLVVLYFSVLFSQPEYLFHWLPCACTILK